MKVRILPFLTTITQQTARLKNFLRGWLLVLRLKEGLVECATVCVKSEVILMILAIMRGNMDVIMYYMMNLDEKVWNRKSDPEIETLKNSTLLHVAALVGNSQIFQLLIHNVTEKMPIDGGGRNPLHFSALKGHFSVSKILLDYLKVA